MDFQGYSINTRDEIGGLVILAVQSFFKNGWMLKELNQTFITLILKSKGACDFNQFGSISLCKVCYKIIAKILVNRLRPLLGLKLEPTQVAFVPNRWIIENVVLAQELIHNFKRTEKKKSHIAIKLDFIKAYDKMEWSFILAVLKAFSFYEKFVNMIKQCA